jgi:acetyl-CoA acetyltransferase
MLGIGLPEDLGQLGEEDVQQPDLAHQEERGQRVPPLQGLRQFLRDAGLQERRGDVNPNGGGISLGHPLGATGARMTATLLNELERRDARYGVATMCIGFGQAIAAVIERLP